MAWLWCDGALQNTSADLICVNIILSMAICGNLFCRTRHYSWCLQIFYEGLGGGTRLAMPKTICVPDSSSLKPGSGATEGVLD